MKLMPECFFLVEGIDGSGKDTFAQFFYEAVKQRFDYHQDKNFSLVGQPAFKFDPSGTVQSFIEDGIVTEPYSEMVTKLKDNRSHHERYLEQYKGITICIRGLLTDMGTLERLYGRHDNNLGQTKPISKLIIVDVEPEIARERIIKRDIPETWRESLDNLRFFREFFIKKAESLPCEHLIIKNDSLELLKHTAQKMVSDLVP